MRNNKLKIIVDTNIFINGLIFPNKHKDCDEIIIKIYEMIDILKTAELVFSQETIGELIYVMNIMVRHNIESNEIQKEFLHSIVDLIHNSYVVNTANTKLKVVCLDPTDNMFLKCAVQAKAHYIISNDIKSGLHKIKGKFKVVTANEFIELFK